MNVFLFDRQTGQTKLVSHAAGSPVTTAHGTSRNAAISADGNWVAYVSNSDNLVAGMTLPAEVQKLEFYGMTAGTSTFTLKFNGVTTATPIPFTGTVADATSIQTALNNLSTVGGIGGSVTVSPAYTGSSASGFLITFGGTLFGADQPNLIATNS